VTQKQITSLRNKQRDSETNNVTQKKQRDPETNKVTQKQITALRNK